MITKTVGFKVGNMVFEPLEAAQKHALELLFKPSDPECPLSELNDLADLIADAIIDNRQIILDILTTTANSRPAARAVNGGRKPRKKRAVVLASDETAKCD
jgi:hypothetical protein